MNDHLAQLEIEMSDPTLSDDEYTALDREWSKAMAEAEAGGSATWRLDAIEATLADPDLTDEAHERWSMAWLAEMRAGVDLIVARAADLTDEERLSVASGMKRVVEALRKLCDPQEGTP